MEDHKVRSLYCSFLGVLNIPWVIDGSVFNVMCFTAAMTCSLLFVLDKIK